MQAASRCLARRPNATLLVNWATWVNRRRLYTAVALQRRGQFRPASAGVARYWFGLYIHHLRPAENWTGYLLQHRERLALTAMGLCWRQGQLIGRSY